MAPLTAGSGRGERRSRLLVHVLYDLTAVRSVPALSVWIGNGTRATRGGKTQVAGGTKNNSKPGKYSFPSCGCRFVSASVCDYVVRINYRRILHSKTILSRS